MCDESESVHFDSRKQCDGTCRLWNCTGKKDKKNFPCNALNYWNWFPPAQLQFCILHVYGELLSILSNSVQVLFNIIHVRLSKYNHAKLMHRKPILHIRYYHWRDWWNNFCFYLVLMHPSWHVHLQIQHFQMHFYLQHLVNIYLLVRTKPITTDNPL